MNCKPGDLAIIICSAADNEGKIVRCIRLATQIEISNNELNNEKTWWVIDRELRSLRGRLIKFSIDEWMRPIRDPGDDAQDETLQWLPVPKLTKNADKVVKDTAKGLQKEQSE